MEMMYVVLGSSGRSSSSGACVGYDGPVHRNGGYHLMCFLILFYYSNLPRGPTRVGQTLVDLCYGGLVQFRGTR